MSTTNKSTPDSLNTATAHDDGWQQFLDGGGNQPPPLVEGNYYAGTLLSAEDLVTHHGGPTGHYAKLIFDIAGVRRQFTASLPSMYVHFDKCTIALAWLLPRFW